MAAIAVGSHTIVKPHGTLGQEVFSELKLKLAAFSDRVTIQETERQMSVEPMGPNTFSIQVSDDGDEMTISALRWHTHEDEAEQTVACVMWLLTPFYRIVDVERGGTLRSSRIERFEPPGQWSPSSEMGLFLWPFGWKRHLVRIAHQQNIIQPPLEFLKQFKPGALDEGGAPIDSLSGSHAIQASS